MNNKKQTTTKIILRLIIFVFVVSIFQIALPIQAANNTSISNYYDNPNQDNGKNPYKFKISDVVSSNILTNVVGCTGVVNKVSTWMTKFLQSSAQQRIMAAKKLLAMKDQLKSVCASTKAGVEAGAGATPLVNDLVSSVKTVFSKLKINVDGQSVQACKDQVDATDDAVLAEMIRQTEQEAEANLKTQCFDGIAITLAKNQLTAMTRSMMNWVNSGYGGNPFFVQNMQNFTNNIERNVLETGIDILLAPKNQNPYASDFARSVVTSRGIGSSSSKFLGTLQSDLGAFITDPKSYYTDDQLGQAQDTRDVLQRARDANYAFQSDFATGGWNAWLALTQRDQNNPLGFTMIASQYLADTQTQQVSEAKDELAQNDGFMSQRTCILWNMVDENGEYIYDDGGWSAEIKTTTNPQPQDECVDWKIITPGSIIKEKTTNYLNSPERQLELVKTINDSLNALFSVLISKLEGGGLLGLSDGWVSKTNWTDNINELTSPDGNTPYDNNGAYDGFNLTRDLGNTYIHGTFEYLGDWDAKNNCKIEKKQDNCPTDEEKWKKLYPDLAPGYYNDENKFIPYGSNKYYIVKKSGSTKLLLEGYNGWAVGDRAFWDGEKWQNWKKGQQNPIKERGVVQIQQDYIVAAKEILGILPNVMTNLGELDYCIPGPNPNYKINSSDAQSAFQDWVGSMYVGAYDNTGSRYGVRIDTAGKRTYDNLQNIYSDNPNVWKSILDNPKIQEIITTFTNICGPDRGDSCSGGYFLDEGSPGNLSSDGAALLREKQGIMDKTLDYVNNHLFQDFYAVFDKKMNELYFKNMTNEYLETENSSTLTPNLAYIPMAESGLDLTKNISFYNDDIVEATNNYTEAIAQAKINIAKLEPIKKEVSGIIKAAQDRRNKNLETILGLTSKQIQDKYATCFAEEDIKFYDADTITNMGSANEERCSNEIDDDLDGLVDENDSDCSGKTAGSTAEIIPEEEGPSIKQSVYGCIIDTNIQVKKFNSSENAHCFTRTKTECELNKYYDKDGNGYSCKFTAL